MWFEAVLVEGGQPWSLYRRFIAKSRRPPVLRFHHFWDEPWAPGRAVVRVESADVAKVADFLLDHDAVEDFGRWQGEASDRKLYGPLFDEAMDFFQASSLFATQVGTQEWRDWYRDKLIHCVLNQNGGGDVRWALQFLWKRWRVFWNFAILRRDPMTYKQGAKE